MGVGNGTVVNVQETMANLDYILHIRNKHFLPRQKISDMQNR